MSEAKSIPSAADYWGTGATAEVDATPKKAIPDAATFWGTDAKPAPAKSAGLSLADAAARFMRPAAGGERKRGGLTIEGKPYAAGDARVVAAPPPAPGSSVLDRPAPPEMLAAERPMTTGEAVAASVAPWKQKEDAALARYQTAAGAPEAREPGLGQRLGEGIRGLTDNPAARGAIAGVSDLAQTGIGAVRGVADLVGADSVADFAGGASRLASAASSGAKSDLRGNDALVADIGSSIVNSVPAMAMGVIGGPALSTLFVQSALAEYNHGRNAGFEPGESAARAGIMGAAEAIGERFGLPEQIKLLKSVGQHLPTGELAKVFGSMLAKEIPGEQLTTALQFVADKAGPAALAPNATLADYLQQAGDTLAVTIGQTALMGGGPAAIGATRNALGRADAAVERSGRTQAENIARDRGLLRPTQARTQAFERLDDLAATHGIPERVVKVLKEEADGKPLASLGGWIRRALRNLAEDGHIAPVDDAALSMLDEPPAEAANPAPAPASPKLDAGAILGTPAAAPAAPTPDMPAPEAAAPAVVQPEVDAPTEDAGAAEPAAPVPPGFDAAALQTGQLLQIAQNPTFPIAMQDAAAAEVRRRETDAMYAERDQQRDAELGAVLEESRDQQADQAAAAGRAGDLQAPTAMQLALQRAQVKPIAGQAINRNWTAFAEDSGTLGIPREQMPQVSAEHRGALVNFLKGRGITHQIAEMPAAELKPTQAEFSPQKVKGAADFKGGDRSILVSADGYVLDGHHQWMAKRDAGAPIKAIALDAPIQDLLRLTHQFPSSTTSGGPRRSTVNAEPSVLPEPSATPVGASDGRLRDAGGGVPGAGPAGQQLGRVDSATAAPGAVAAAPAAVPDGTGEAGALTPEQPLEPAPAAATAAPALETAAAGPPMVAKPTKPTEIFAGNYGRGMSEHVAKIKAREFTRTRPELTWAIAEVPNDPKYEPGRFLLEGRPASKSPAQPVSAAADVAPTDEANSQRESQAAPAPGEAGTAAPVDGPSGEGGTSVVPRARPAAAEAPRVKARRPAKHPDAVRGSTALAAISRALGGISPDLQADLTQKVSRERAGKSGKRTRYTAWDNPAIPGVGLLFRNGGTSDLTELARVLEEEGFIAAGTLERDYLEARSQAQDIIKRELAQGGSTVRLGDQEAVDAEMTRRRDAAMDDLSWTDSFIPDELDELGYADASPEVRAEVDALMAQAEAAGIDTESLIERASAQTEGESHEAYEARLQQLASEALAGGAADRQQAAGAPSDAGEKRGARGPDEAAGEAEGLNAEERGAQYQVDLFGEPFELSGDRLSDERGSDRPGPVAVDPGDVVSRTSVQPPRGTYAGTTKLVTTREQKLGHVGPVRDLEHAANALSYLKRSAVERVDVLVTDKGGKPLAVIGGFKGALAEASVHPATLIGEAMQIEGAADLWLVHNHPSGKTDLSPADRRLEKAVAGVLEGTSISSRGIIAVGGGAWSGVRRDGADEQGELAPADGPAVPAQEREIDRDGRLGPPITSPELAKDMARRLSRDLGATSGLVLLDSNLAPMAFVPWSGADALPLRNNGRLDALFRAVANANAGAAIIVQGNMPLDRAQNLAAGLQRTSVRVIDIVAPTGKSAAERGETLVSPVLLSRRDSSPVAMPPVAIGGGLGLATLHPRYAEAKGGDAAAALELARDVVSDAFVEEVRALIGDAKPVVQPVAALEESGRNKIPRAVAEVLAKRLGLETGRGIVQSNRPKRTALDGLSRLFAVPEFDGEVKAGAQYLLVDDTLTQGGTYAALASHIRQNGGTVVGAAALTGKRYGATMALSPKFLQEVRERFADVESSFRAATGYGFDALTESEARYLAKHNAPDTVRDRIVEEGRRAGERLDEGPARPLSSRGAAPGGVDAELLTDWAASIAKRWVDAPRIRVAGTVGALPGQIREWIASANAEGSVRALMIPETNEVWLVASQLASMAQAQFALFHEVYGHVGLRKVMGDQYERALSVLRMANPQLRSEARRWMHAYGAAEIQARVEQGMAPAAAAREVSLLSVEEALSDRAGFDRPIKGWERFVAKLEAALRAIGLDTVANWLEKATQAQTLQMLADARDAVVRGRPAPAAAVSPGASAAPAFSRTEEMVGVSGPAEAEAVRRGYRDRVSAALDRVDRAVNGLGTLPDTEQFLAQRYRALGKIAAIDKVAGEIRATFRKATPAEKKAIYAYLTDAGGRPETIDSPEVRAMAVSVKGYINTVGDQLVKRGLLSEAAHEEYRDRYLPRLYLSHLLDEGDWRSVGAGKKVSDLGYLKRRKDIPQEIRDVILGEVKDPAFLAATAIAKPMRDMALLDWLEQISQNTKWIHPQALAEWQGRNVSAFWLKAEAEALRTRARLYPEEVNRDKANAIAEDMETRAAAALDGLDLQNADYKQLPNNARYGRLRGLLVRREIYDDMMGVQDFIPRDMNWFQSWFGYGGVGTKITQLWKMSKVTLNVPGQIRNAVGNMVMLQLSGVALHRLPRRLGQAISQVANEGPAWKAAQKYGVTESTFSAQELFRIRRDLLELEREVRGMSPLLAVKTFGARIADFAGDAYQTTEAVFKTLKIIDAMEHDGLSEEKAALEAQKWLFDYSLIRPSLRYARGSPIGIPFVTFGTKVLPRLAEVALLHPQRFLPWVGLMYGLQMWAQAVFGGDDDEWDQLKKALPKWMQDKGHIAFLPFRDAAGRLQAVDLSYFFPWTQFSEVVRNFGDGAVGGVLKSIGLFGGPISSAIAGVLTGYDSFTKRQILNDADPTSVQAASLTAYLWDLAMPPMMTSSGVVSPMWLLGPEYGGKLAQASTGSTNSRGDPRATFGQAASRFVGLNIYGIDPVLTRDANLAQMDGDIKATALRLRSKLRDRGLTDEQRKKWVETYQAELAKRRREREEYEEKSKVPAWAVRSH